MARHLLLAKSNMKGDLFSGGVLSFCRGRSLELIDHFNRMVYIHICKLIKLRPAPWVKIAIELLWKPNSALPFHCTVGTAMVNRK